MLMVVFVGAKLWQYTFGRIRASMSFARSACMARRNCLSKASAVLTVAPL